MATDRTNRGFISSLYLYLIAGVVIVGMAAFILNQQQRVGILKSENSTLKASVEWMNDQMQKQNAAQQEALTLKAKAERDANKARIQMAELRRQYEELFNTVLADDLVNRLRNAIAETNGDLPTGESDRQVPTPLPQG